MGITYKTKEVLLRTFQFIVIFLVALFLAKYPFFLLHYIQDTFPDFGYLSIQNRVFVILFLTILLKVYGKKHYHLFKIDPLKIPNTYSWVLVTLILCYFMVKFVSHFENPTMFRLLSLSFHEYFQALLFTVILIPIEEELLFRGFLILVPSPKLKYLMLIISTCIFASIHIEPSIIFWPGLGFGILAIRFNNIWVPIIAHALWNLFVAFFSF